MSKEFNATPLFDAHKVFIRLPLGMAMFEDYPDSKEFISASLEAIPEVRGDVLHTQSFLKSYSRKSEATYRGYRNEIERLLLWAWTIANKSVIQLKRPDLEAYFDFECKKTLILLLHVVEKTLFGFCCFGVCSILICYF